VKELISKRRARIIIGKDIEKATRDQECDEKGRRRGGGGPDPLFLAHVAVEKN